MPTYQIHYTTEATGEEQHTELVLSVPATDLQIAEAVVRHAHPEESQEIGDVFDIAVDDPNMTETLSLMAEWGVLTVWYTVDDNPEEIHL
ncbi:MAG: hypothetical protein JWP38_3767 [Herbaspirillum sp.]|nr:hypothetical protein [Herbaspirillum sp.]